MNAAPCTGPSRRFRLGRYVFARYGRRRWEVSTTYGLGVGPSRSPLRAFLALRRLERDPDPLFDAVRRFEQHP